jgi:hypothetical protein
MSKWSVQIAGDTFDLEDLMEWFNSPVLNVIRRGDEFYVHSTLFDTAKDSGKVRDLANDLAEEMIGVARLFRPDFGPVKLGAVQREHVSGARDIYLSVSESITVRTKIRGKLTVTGDRRDPGVPKPALWLNVALTDEKVSHALRLWGRRKQDWVNLYRILEIIESDVGGLIYQENWVSKTNITRFTRTANSPEVLGDAARHAKKRDPPPRKPMRIHEAEDLMRGLLQRWVDSKKAPQ